MIRKRNKLLREEVLEVEVRREKELERSKWRSVLLAGGDRTADAFWRNSVKLQGGVAGGVAGLQPESLAICASSSARYWYSTT